MFEHRNEGQGAVHDPSVPLPDMAAKALDVLSRDDDGFSLLIEEEGVDEMAHHDNAHLTIEAGAALDRAENLTVVNLPFAATRALAKLAQRNMQLTCTIQDGQIWMADSQQSVAIEPAVRQSPPAPG